jgi:hypothetical protein
MRSKSACLYKTEMSHNVPVVTDVLVAGRANAKAKNTILTPILRLQATKMWRRQKRAEGKARTRFFVARAAEQAA